MNDIEGMDRLLQRWKGGGETNPSERLSPKVPFDIGQGVVVQEWHVIEPRREGNHYQFNGTIVTRKETGETRYKLGNPSSDYCLADMLGQSRRKWRESVPIGYDPMVEAYLRARG